MSIKPPVEILNQFEISGNLLEKKKLFLEHYCPIGVEYGYGYSSPGIDNRNPESRDTPELIIDKIRIEEYPNLYDSKRNSKGLKYLDHAGATLYPQSYITECIKALLPSNENVIRQSPCSYTEKANIGVYPSLGTTNVYGNPHSQGLSSSLSMEAIEQTRAKIFEFFDTDASTYDCIFTSGATAGLKLVAESFPFKKLAKYLNRNGWRF